MSNLFKMLAVAVGICSVTACSVARGVVTDKATGEPITSAQVSIAGERALTDPFGEYNVRSIFVFPWESLTLVATAPGYNMHTEAIGSTGATVNLALTHQGTGYGNGGAGNSSSINNAPNIIFTGMPGVQIKK